MRAMPKNALEIQVTGKQWAWTAEYKNGVRSAEIVVPVNKDVKIILASEDVLHSFYVPSFRIKQDAVPGRYTAVWFNAEKLGEFYVFCTELCGTLHSSMITKLKVVTQEDFDKWLIAESEVGQQRHRPLHSGPAGEGRIAARPGSGPAHSCAASEP